MAAVAVAPGTRAGPASGLTPTAAPGSQASRCRILSTCLLPRLASWLNTLYRLAGGRADLVSGGTHAVRDLGWASHDSSWLCTCADDGNALMWTTDDSEGMNGGEERVVEVRRANSSGRLSSSSAPSASWRCGDTMPVHAYACARDHPQTPKTQFGRPGQVVRCAPRPPPLASLRRDCVAVYSYAASGSETDG
jgi:hypothetical protein